MVSNEEIEARFRALKEVFFVQAGGDGYHYQLTIVSNAFCGKSKVARQQWVYAQLKDLITTGALHALNMKTYTEEEWGGLQHG